VEVAQSTDLSLLFAQDSHRMTPVLLLVSSCLDVLRKRQRKHRQNQVDDADDEKHLNKEKNNETLDRTTKKPQTLKRNQPIADEKKAFSLVVKAYQQYKFIGLSFVLFPFASHYTWEDVANKPAFVTALSFAKPLCDRMEEVMRRLLEALTNRPSSSSSSSSTVSSSSIPSSVSSNEWLGLHEDIAYLVCSFLTGSVCSSPHRFRVVMIIFSLSFLQTSLVIIKRRLHTKHVVDK
jgi:hypothetical protein